MCLLFSWGITGFGYTLVELCSSPFLIFISLLYVCFSYRGRKAGPSSAYCLAFLEVTLFFSSDMKVRHQDRRSISFERGPLWFFLLGIMNKTGVLFSKKQFLFLRGKEGRVFWVQGAVGLGLGGTVTTGLNRCSTRGIGVGNLLLLQCEGTSNGNLSHTIKQYHTKSKNYNA